MSCRKSAVAGSFYPNDPVELGLVIKNLLNRGSNTKTCPKIIISPHAGYIYSGIIAARAYSTILSFKNLISRVVIIGPSHFVWFKGLAVPSDTYFSTPLGDVPVDRDAIKSLSDYVVVNNEAHKKEHSIEVQIPFLQCVLSDFSIVPIVVGDASAEEVSRVIEILWGGTETLFVLSTDLSHYHSYDECNKIDKKTSEYILKKDFQKLSGEMACGYSGLRGMLNTVNKLSIDGKLLGICNSGDTSGSKDRVVGYGAYSFGDLLSDISYSDDYKRFLLKLARSSILYGLKNNTPMKSFDDSYNIFIKRATFVTLEIDGKLRGCIGSLLPTRDLAHDVVSNAYSAAFRDSRFSPVNIDDLKKINITISILSMPVQIIFNSEDDLLRQIKPGIHGLILYEGDNCGTFLPAVWDDIKDKKDFLNHLKVKAGLDFHYWSDTIKCSSYTTQAFSDEDF